MNFNEASEKSDRPAVLTRQTAEAISTSAQSIDFTVGTIITCCEEEDILDEREDGSLVLLSKYALDCKPYNTEFTYVT